MSGLRRTGQILAVALVPWLTTGCTSTNSRLASVAARSAEEQEAAWARAQQLEKAEQLAAAQQIYAELHRRDPKSARYAHRLGVVCTMLGDHERAGSAYGRARELDPQNPDLLADMGYAAILRKDYVEAESLLQASLSVSEFNPRALSNLALAVGLQGREEECMTLFRQVHGQDEAEVLCSVAYVKSQRGDNSGAIELYRQALAIDPALNKATVAMAELKAKSKTEQVAQGKPYRKYMNENTPKPPERPSAADVAAVNATQQTPNAAVDVDVALAEKADEPTGTPAEADSEAAQPAFAADDDQALTGWDSEEADIAAKATREFPEDVTETGEEPVAEDAGWIAVEHSPQEAAEEPVEEVAAEPVTASEDSDSERFGGAGRPAPNEGEFEIPEQTADGWAATQFDVIEPFSPAWVTHRNEQISARSGQPCFMGFCPVALRDEQKLVDALPQYQATYQHQTYQFNSEEALEKFEAQPERYLAAAGGLDVVAVSQGTAVAQGSLENALWFQHKLYLFLNRENLDAFRTQTRQFAVQE